MNAKLYVANLSFDITEEQLRQFFSQAGSVLSVAIPLNHVTSHPRGFALVEMQSPDEARQAIKLLNGKEMGGYQIRVNEARAPVHFRR